MNQDQFVESFSTNPVLSRKTFINLNKDIRLCSDIHRIYSVSDHEMFDREGSVFPGSATLT